MNNFLFPKQNQGEKFASYRFRAGFRAGIVGLISNLFLFIIKITVGVFADSVSVIGEAMNSLSDSGSSAVSLVGFYLSQKPADKEHPFGHARAEYMISAFVAMAIIFIGITLAEESFNRIINPKSIEIYSFTFAVLLISVAVKIFLSFFYNKVGKDINSGILIAQGYDSRSDILSTVVVLIGMIAAPFTSLPVDGGLGLIVALFICYSGFEILKEPLNHLLGASVSKEDEKEIADLLFTQERILGIHDLIVHDYGPMHRFASVHVEVNSRENLLEIHSIIDSLEEKALDELGLQLTIHMDPIVVGDPKEDSMKEDLRRVLKSIDDSLKFHDFRVVETHGSKNLIFDVEMPAEGTLSTAEINSRIQTKLKEIDPKYQGIITFDQNYFRSITYGEKI